MVFVVCFQGHSRDPNRNSTPGRISVVLEQVLCTGRGPYTTARQNISNVNIVLIEVLIVITILLAAPRFTVSEERRRRNLIAIPVGNSVRMDCSATGYPKPTVKWYKDKALFQQRKGVFVGRFQTLVTIRDAVLADSGLYICNVSNAYGWINNSYRVDVHGKGMWKYHKNKGRVKQ